MYQGAASSRKSTKGFCSLRRFGRAVAALRLLLASAIAGGEFGPWRGHQEFVTCISNVTLSVISGCGSNIYTQHKTLIHKSMAAWTKTCGLLVV